MRDAAKKFASEKLMPKVIKAFNEENYDREIMTDFGQNGFIGTSFSDYGLPNISAVAHGIILLLLFINRVDCKRN